MDNKDYARNVLAKDILIATLRGADVLIVRHAAADLGRLPAVCYDLAEAMISEGEARSLAAREACSAAKSEGDQA